MLSRSWTVCLGKSNAEQVGTLHLLVAAASKNSDAGVPSAVIHIGKFLLIYGNF